MRTAFLAFSLLLVVYAGRSFAAPTGNDLVKTELLADVASIRPGQTFAVGVRFTIEPGWHIYWLNPGDAGEATHVRIDAPPGFVVGEMKFPLPHEFHDPGDITAYGYQHEVMLLASVRAPADLKTGSEISIAVKSDWLVCEKVCLPGESTNELKLPVAAQASPPSSSATLFATWHSLLPMENAAADAITTRRDGDSLRVHFSLPVRSSAGKWNVFPGPSDSIALKNLKITAGSNVINGELALEVLPGASLRQESLLCLLNNLDRAEGVTFSVPLRDLWSTTTRPARP